MSDPESDLLAAEAMSPLNGSPLQLLAPGEVPDPGGVRLLVDRSGLLPPVDPADFDAMVTARPDAPSPWVSMPVSRIEAQLAAARATATAAPVATAMLARLLRHGEALAFDTALELESLAYSTLLGGSEFARWLRAPRRNRLRGGVPEEPQVRYERTGNQVTLTLAAPGTRNAMTAAMRDALYEALVNVLEDPTRPGVQLRADGKCFSTGGALDEFGTAPDFAAAHIIRTQRSCARVLHRLGERATVLLHGACIGSGIEIPAAAACRIAAPDLVVQLPELRMGLVPGAGGTVTLARAIGRHRLLWLALGAFRIGASQARDWGLVHEIRP